MAKKFQTPEGDPLIDLCSMTEEEVTQLLFRPILRRYATLLLFSDDSSQIALQPSSHRSKEWIVQDLVKIEDYRGISIPALFQEAGMTLDLFSEAYLNQARQFVREKWHQVLHEIEASIKPMD